MPASHPSSRWSCFRSCREIPVCHLTCWLTFLSDKVVAETVAVTIWGGAEGSITIMAASIPVLRTLITREKTAPRVGLSLANKQRQRGQVSYTTNSSISPSSGKMEFSSLPLHAWHAED